MLYKIPNLAVLSVSLFFLMGGVAHFTAADFFIRAMPEYLGYHWELVVLSGCFELLGAVGLLLSRTRLWAGYGLMALCIAVFPANINMALHPEQYSTFPVWVLYLRLPLQFLMMIYIWWAIKPERLCVKNKLS